MRKVNFVQPPVRITSNDSQNMPISLSLSTYQAFHIKTITRHGWAKKTAEYPTRKKPAKNLGRPHCSIKAYRWPIR